MTASTPEEAAAMAMRALGGFTTSPEVDARDFLAALPEGCVLVTKESLAVALRHVSEWADWSDKALLSYARVIVAAISHGAECSVCRAHATPEVER